ncbi:hypothetical protein STEG23_011287, partial [Scotinomys teguina]
TRKQVKSFAQGPTSMKLQSWDLNQGTLAPNGALFKSFINISFAEPSPSSKATVQFCGGKCSESC